jgi:hypothetical protein
MWYFVFIVSLFEDIAFHLSVEYGRTVGDNFVSSFLLQRKILDFLCNSWFLQRICLNILTISRTKQIFRKTVNFRCPKETAIGSVVSENYSHYLPQGDIPAFWSLIWKESSNSFSWEGFCASISLCIANTCDCLSIESMNILSSEKFNLFLLNLVLKLALKFVVIFSHISLTAKIQM